jgi:DHA1 family inner membrane transport protein
MLGAALNHSSLNIANGLGAFLGSVVIEAGDGYRAPSAVGVALALGGLAIFGLSVRQRRRAATVPTGYADSDASASASAAR